VRGQLPIGSVLAGYRIVGLIGDGAGGAVYLAEHEGGGEPVALKVLADELARDDRFRQRFLRESTIAAGLRHPHVVPILDFGEADGGLYLAMRRVEGADLRALLARDGPLAPEEALGIVAQVGEALDEAHAGGLVHRDVTPANILVDRDGTAYLGDFGLAKHASSPSSLTGEQSFVGTIAYVAPEQIKGERVDGRADVYALTCVLYEALTGRPPFERESELAVLFAHLHEQAPRASDVRPELPPGLDRVLRTGTAKDPKDRYASCAELIAAARGTLAGERGPRAPLRVRTVALAAVVLAAAAAGIMLASDGGDEPAAPAAPVPRLAVGGDGLALVNPRTRTVAARVRLPGVPSDVVFDRRSAWALLGDQQQVAQIDVKRHTVTRTVKLPFPAGGIAIGGGAVFVTERDGAPGVARISTRTGRVTARWTVETRGVRSSEPSGIAAGAGSVWLARGAEVVRVDAGSGRVRHRFPLTLTATLLQFAAGDLWAASSENGRVEKIDPATDRIVARVTLHGWLSAMAVAGGSVWVTAVPDDVVFRLNVDDASVQGQTRGAGGAESLASAPGAIFVAGSRERALARLEPASGRRAAIALTGSPQLVRQHDGLLWVAAAAQPALPAAAPGPQVRVAVAAGDVQIDPAFGLDPTAAQLHYATCLKLVNYPDAAGAAGQRLVPEAAAALPTRSADGRTYSFRIRDGLRFSPPSGAPVTAAAFKRAIERTIAPAVGSDSQGVAVLSDVVGAEAYNRGRARAVRGIVAQGSKLSITLRAPAGDLASRLALPIFCAVPTGTPAPGHTTGPIASAGPYYVHAEAAGQLVLDRNPNYRGARPRRPARIVYLTGVPPAKAVALADGGQADVVPWDFDLNSPTAPGGALARSAMAGRYNAAAAPGVDLLAFNTRRPLFRDVRLRRAVNYALDRPALAGIFGEAVSGRYVPPAVPGAGRSAVYPLSGPDLARARALAGRGPARPARLYFCGDPANLRIARTVRANLRPIGLRVVIVQSLGCLSGPDPKARTADLLLVTRSTQVLDPEPFLRAATGDSRTFGRVGLPTTWSDRAYRRRLADAALLSGDARLAALRRIEDDMLRRAAPYAAYGSFTSGEYLSARSACRVIQGAYGIVDLAALCARKR
jgi:ABC-type transport system substrate-binding protein